MIVQIPGDDRTDSGYIRKTSVRIIRIFAMPQLKPIYVTKSNSLVEACYSLTLAELRILLATIAQIDSRPGAPPITADTPFSLHANDLAPLFQVETKQAYELLRDGVARLSERWVHIDARSSEYKKSYIKTRWVSAILYVDEAGYLDLYFSPKVLPFLTSLAREFTRYQIKHVAPMSSVYAIRLYELLKQWVTIGERQLDIAEIKAMLMIEDAYPSVFELKRRVITPAVQQINKHSDLKVTLDQRKRGRAITALIFKIESKRESQPEREKTPAKPRLTRKYIEQHAYPGESWEDAEARLKREQGAR
ncbi:RepB family plasmid replication initiator protein [Allochromatium humboldtianum]|nr:RepB family plasmid replication initiator protein [Allochromatium humboldtianum]